MKRKNFTIATAAVSAAAVLAMPFCAFAEQTEGTPSGFTDTVEITVGSACGLSESQSLNESTEIIDETFTAMATVGTTHEWSSAYVKGGENQAGLDGNGKTINVICNDLGGWEVKAVADNSAKMMAENGGTDISTFSSTETYDTFVKGAESRWAFKIEESSSVIETGGYGGWSAIPSSSTTVATAYGATTAANGSFSTAYWVYVGTAQQADTYTGTVNYTLLHPASEPSTH